MLMSPCSGVESGPQPKCTCMCFESDQKQNTKSLYTGQQIETNWQEQDVHSKWRKQYKDYIIIRDKSALVKFLQERYATLHITAMDRGQISIVRYKEFKLDCLNSTSS